jgi:hypothetical protein
MSDFSIPDCLSYSPNSIELLGPDSNKLLTNIKSSFELINKLTKHEFERPEGCMLCQSNKQTTRIIDEMQYWTDGEELETLVDKSNDVQLDTISDCVDAFLELKILIKIFNRILSSTNKDFSIESTIQNMRVLITHMDKTFEEEFDKESWEHLYLIGKTPEEMQKHNFLKERELALKEREETLNNRESIFKLREKEFLSNITERELALKEREESLKELLKNIQNI